MRLRATAALVALCLVASALGAGGVRAQSRSVKSDEDVLFKADTLSHDQKLGIVTARGHVELTQGDRILRADMVSYNQKADLVTATGNVVLMEPTGEVLFADHAELTGDLKSGAIANIRMLMADNARMAANDAQRTGAVTELNKAVYSPCRACLGKNGPLLWQIKAVKVIHNQNEKIVEYKDAWMEFLGVPVAYTPYLSHPDPTVKRKSGFLVPRYGNDSELGVILETPYYIDIAPDKDATVRPIITSNEGPVLAGEYRQRFVDGELRFDASGTYGSGEDGGKEPRGHFFGETRFDLDPTWRAGADLQLASDDTYLRRYNFNSLDQLTSTIFAEGFRGRNYARAEGFYWRGLRVEDVAGQTPIVAPFLNFNYVGQPGRYGGRWDLDANMMVLTKTAGDDSRRLSLRTGWALPHIARDGQVFRLYADLRTDAYWVNSVQEPDRPAGSLSSGVTGRVSPRIGLDWRYPWARSSGSTTQIIEPVAGIAFSPNGGNPGLIPNEDSQDFELDDTNLLSHNRFTGVDRIEGGMRAYYGLKASVVGASGASSAFVGQAYRLRRDRTFPVDSGLDDHFSDIVGRVEIRPNLPASLEYRFRFDKDNLRAKRNEATLNLGPPALNVAVDYAFFDRGAGSGEFNRREEVTAGISSQFTPEWSVSASTRRDLEAGRSISHSFGLRYRCDCFTATLTYTRTFTQDRDIRPSETFFLRLVFKNLGSVETVAGRTSESKIAEPDVTQ